MKKFIFTVLLLSLPFQTFAAMEITEGTAIKGAIFAVKTANKY